MYICMYNLNRNSERFIVSLLFGNYLYNFPENEIKFSDCNKTEEICETFMISGIFTEIFFRQEIF